MEILTPPITDLLNALTKCLYGNIDNWWYCYVNLCVICITEQKTADNGNLGKSVRCVITDEHKVVLFLKTYSSRTLSLSRIFPVCCKSAVSLQLQYCQPPAYGAKSTLSLFYTVHLYYTTYSSLLYGTAVWNYTNWGMAWKGLDLFYLLIH